MSVGQGMNNAQDKRPQRPLSIFQLNPFSMQNAELAAF